MTKARTIVALTAMAAVLTGCAATDGIFRDRDDLIAPTTNCMEQRFDVYFEENQAGLTAAAHDMVRARAESLAGCDIRHVRVLGLSDAVGGTDESNMTLSQRRARAVARAFAETGWPVPAFELDAAGAAGATTQGGAQEPLRRRTEVVVEAVAR
jgi:peptidoglycan-associated lipoprotein